MKPATVLVVDDNVELAENVSEILANAVERPIECLLADSAERAIVLADQHRDAIDVLILDRRLPDADGLELVSELRRRAPVAEALIITGDVKVESALAAVGRGVFAYVLKPFAAADLVQATLGALARVALVREREELRRELEQSERRYREVVEAVPAFVLAIDADGKILLWNRRLEEATGYSRDEMVGRNAREILSNAGDQKLPLKSGGHRIVRWQLAEAASGAEGMTYAVGIDVTGERAMQLRTLRAERLAAVGTLAAGLAHEVRNPLNSASLQLQVLRRRLERAQTAPQALLPVMDVVHDEIQRLDRLVTDFLAFARPQNLAFKSVAISKLIAGIAHQLRPEAAAAHVEVVVSADAPDVTIDADPERLRQVLINLVRNGIEALGTRGGCITLRTLPVDAEGFATVQIEDNGPGVPENAPIFDAFYTTKEGGTGLGLAIVHRIVQEHGGSIQLESKPGRTCFSLRLPVQNG